MNRQTMTPAFAQMIMASVEDGLIAPDEPIAREARWVLGNNSEAMTLKFNGTRYQIGDADLHCGDTFNIRIAGKWLPVRIEIDASNAWYLIGADIVEAEGCEARI